MNLKQLFRTGIPLSARQPKSGTLGYGAAGLVLSVILLTGCSGSEQTGASESPDEIKASVMTVTPQPVPVFYNSSGVVVSEQRVTITSRLSGYIRDLSVNEGDRVKAGQVLFRVDPVDARSQQESARAALVQAEADLADAESDRRRFETLFEQGAVSRRQLDKARLRVKVARSAVKQAKAALRSASNQLTYAEVRAPANGIVVRKLKRNGDLATPGAPILTMENPDNLVVDTHVDEANISHVQVGDKVQLRFPAFDKQLTGEVLQVVGAADPVAHNFLVKIALPAEVNVLAGAYVKVRFTVATREALMLPEEALFSRGDLPAVYTVDEQHIAHYRLVRLGQKYNGQYEVTAGLSAGAKVVTGAEGVLRSGMRIVAGE